MADFRRRAIRRRRRSPEALPDDPMALVPMSVDVPRWLFELLEGEAEQSGYSRASIASEWLEEKAQRSDGTKVRRLQGH